MKKRLLTSLLCLFVVVACFSITVKAADDIKNENCRHWVVTSDVNGSVSLTDIATGEEMTSAYHFNDNGQLAELDLVEYADFMNSVPCIPTEQSDHGTRNAIHEDIPRASSTFYSFRETRNYVGKGTPAKVSADLVGPGTISYFTSTSVSDNFGGDVSATWEIKDAIQFGASFGWNHTLESQTQVGYELSVPANRTGYIQFTPYLNVTVGDLYYVLVATGVYDETYEGEVWGSSPMKIAGNFADGVYEVIVR